jgi:hypothetical protein
LAVLQAERAAIGAKGRQIDTEAAPIRYVAELVGEGRAAVATTITLLATSGTRRAVFSGVAVRRPGSVTTRARGSLNLAPTLTPKAGAGVKLG